MKSFLKKSALRSASCLQALAVVGVTAGAVVIAAPAVAQDYTSGVLSGTVTDESGAPVSGATVTLSSTAQGFTRTSTTGASGSFRFANLPTGAYTIEVNASGMDLFTATDVSVIAAQTSDLSIGLTSTGNEIVVLGASIVQDFTSTTTGVNVNVQELVKTVPISRDLTSVALLAPGTSRGDSAFGNLASIAGGSVAENAYYVNGLNITNFDNYLGAANVPFDFYQTVEVKSGGYSAEFGRATGGIVNTTTKSGSNEFFAAGHVNWSPDFLRASAKDLQTCSYVTPPTAAAPNPQITCADSTNRSFDTVETRSLTLEAGGPIIKDRLFVYGLVEFRKDTSRTIDARAGTAYLRNSDDPFWGVKIDAYPIDNHHLEFTMFDSTQVTTRTDAVYNNVDGVPSTGIGSSVSDFRSGGLSYVAKYTGNFTDWFTLSAAYGKMKDRFDNVGVAGDAGLPYFRNLSGTDGVFGVNNGAFYNGQRVASTSFPYATQREFFRGDADFYFSLFGDHHIRGGFDVEKNTLTESNVRTGGTALYSAGYLSDAAYFANTGGIGGAGFYLAMRAPNVVEFNYFNSGGTFTAENKAFYIQDEWDLTDRLTLSLGLRRDDFGVNRADGVQLVNLDKNYSPRLGVTYDLWDDHSGRFKAFYGTYYLPIASNTAFRMTGYEYYIRERYYTDGINSNGLPNITGQVMNDPSYQGDCPFGLTPFSSGSYCNVTGDGSVADPSALIASNLKATKSDEFIVGYEHNFSDVPVFGELNASVDYTRRRLKANAEDAAIDAAVLAYCDAEGIAGCSSTWTGFHQYTIINPGQEVTVALDGLDGRVVTFTPEQLGYDDATRKYDAVTFEIERPWDGVWTLSGSYTWSKTRGNSEGYVQSDFGQDDAGITQDFDQPGFMDGAYGYLPTDRRHRFKLWGAYQLFEGFTVGSNVSIDAPRPLSCFGHHPTDPFANAYGAASRYCVTGNGQQVGELSPRGTAQESDWLYEVDLKFAYALELSSGQTVRLRADVFNLFNSSGVTERNEIGEQDSRVVDPNGNWYPVNPSYGLATSYQSPRTVRLGFDVEF